VHGSTVRGGGGGPSNGSAQSSQRAVTQPVRNVRQRGHSFLQVCTHTHTNYTQGLLLLSTWIFP
jgi:hypothetical protein